MFSNKGICEAFAFEPSGIGSHEEKTFTPPRRHGSTHQRAWLAELLTTASPAWLTTTTLSPSPARNPSQAGAAPEAWAASGVLQRWAASGRAPARLGLRTRRRLLTKAIKACSEPASHQTAAHGAKASGKHWGCMPIRTSVAAPPPRITGPAWFTATTFGPSPLELSIATS